MKSAILINDTSMEGHIGSKAVIDNMRRLCKENGVKIVSTFTRRDIQEWCSRLDGKLKTCDIIIINGEGTFHDNPPFFDILVNRRHKYEGKKIAFINSVWQNITNFNSHKFFEMCDIISFRESLSLQEFKKNNKHENVFLVPDVILATKIPDISIGFGDSVVPHLDNDLKTFYNFFPMHRSKTPDLYAYISWLKSLNMYVTGRFHGVCLAVLAGVPFYAYPSNSHKIEGILKDMKCEELLGTPGQKMDVSKMDFINLKGKMKDYKIKANDLIDDLFYRIGEL